MHWRSAPFREMKKNYDKLETHTTTPPNTNAYHTQPNINTHQTCQNTPTNSSTRPPANTSIPHSSQTHASTYAHNNTQRYTLCVLHTNQYKNTSTQAQLYRKKDSWIPHNLCSGDQQLGRGIWSNQWESEKERERAGTAAGLLRDGEKRSSRVFLRILTHRHSPASARPPTPHTALQTYKHTNTQIHKYTHN